MEKNSQNRMETLFGLLGFGFKLRLCIYHTKWKKITRKEWKHCLGYQVLDLSYVCVYTATSWIRIYNYFPIKTENKMEKNYQNRMETSFGLLGFGFKVRLCIYNKMEKKYQKKMETLFGILGFGFKLCLCIYHKATSWIQSQTFVA